MDFFTGFKTGLELLRSILTAEPRLTITLLIFFGGSLILSFVAQYFSQQKLRRSGILEVDKMKGRDFEEYLQVLLKYRGYKVSLTSITGDFGADLVLSNSGKKTVVQAKRYNKKVGLKAVQEIVSAKNHYKADECWVITNNFFTTPAKKLASSNNVVLIDRNLLMNWMLDMNKGA